MLSRFAAFSFQGASRLLLFMAAVIACGGFEPRVKSVISSIFPFYLPSSMDGKLLGGAVVKNNTLSRRI